MDTTPWTNPALKAKRSEYLTEFSRGQPSFLRLETRLPFLRISPATFAADQPYKKRIDPQGQGRKSFTGHPFEAEHDGKTRTRQDNPARLNGRGRR